jgi:hypothetical protein
VHTTDSWAWFTQFQNKTFIHSLSSKMRQQTMQSELALFLSDLVTGPVTIEMDNARSLTNASEARRAIASCKRSSHRRHSFSETNNKKALRWGESPPACRNEAEHVCRWATSFPSPPVKYRETAQPEEVTTSVYEPIKLSLNKPMRLASPTSSRSELCCNLEFLQRSLPLLPTSREESREVNVREFLDSAIYFSTP